MIWGYPQYCCSFSYCLFCRIIYVLSLAFFANASLWHWLRMLSWNHTGYVQLITYRRGALDPKLLGLIRAINTRVLQEPLQQIYHPTSIFQTHNSSGGCDLLLKQPQKPVIMAGMGTGLATMACCDAGAEGGPSWCHQVTPFPPSPRSGWCRNARASTLGNACSSLAPGTSRCRGPALLALLATLLVVVRLQNKMTHLFCPFADGFLKKVQRTTPKNV